MSDNGKPQENQPIPPETATHIKTLFSRLTELILSSCLSRRMVADAMCMIGNWASVIYASLIIMVEEKKTDSDMRAEQIGLALTQEIKKHTIMLRGMKKDVNKGKSRIVLPKGTARE